MDWPLTIAVGLSAVILTVVLVVVWRFRAEYRARIAALEARLTGADGKQKSPLTRMVRVKAGQGALNDKNSALIKSAGVLDLREEFRNRPGGGGVGPPGAGKIGLCSISDYLATLKPEMDPTFKGSVVEEVDALLSMAILKSLGPTMSPIVLPLLGWANVAGSVVKAAGSAGLGQGHGGQVTVASVADQLFSKVWEATSDLSLMGFGAGTDTYATVVKLRQDAAKQQAEQAERERKEKAPSDNKTPLLPGSGGGGEVRVEVEMAKVAEAKEAEEPPIAPNTRKNPFASPQDFMRWGEAKSPTWTPEAFPSPFVMETHFEQALETILGLERAVEEKKGVKYDPDAFPIDVPTPINPAMLPGLYRGFGGVVKTQTYRETQTARTLDALLNRLAANETFEQGEAKFVVSIGGKDVTQPEQLIQGLMDTGHEVLCRVRFNVVSFGYGLCIKEEDGSWTNVPWAIVLRSGYEDRQRRPAHCFLNHGGLNLNISGPILKKCSTQHHSALDGFVGWYTNETCNVPWLAEKMELGEPILGDDCISAVRFCGLYAASLNKCATNMQLPAGGYALMGVCLDSTAVIEHALTGHLSSYPTLHLGRFHAHALRQARATLKRLQASGDSRAADMQKVVDAMNSLPTDIGATPSGAADAARRIICCTPKSMPFKIMARTVEACKDMIAEAEEDAS